MKKFVVLLCVLCMAFIVAACESDTVEGAGGHTHYFSSASCSQPETCFVCGMTRGTTLDHTFVLGVCTECDAYSEFDCPTLCFDGNMSGMVSKEDVKKVKFEYRTKEQTISGYAKIKFQGSSSMAYEKKNYTINLYENQECSQKMGLDVGWGEQNKYCLKANWVDKTHARNIVTAKLAGEVQKKYGLLDVAPNNGAIDGFPIAVYINGSFQGLYTMNIPKDAWMFAMDEDNPNHIVIAGDSWNDPVLFKEIPTDFSDWALEVGQENEETLQKVQRLIAFVRDSSDKEFKNNFEQYLNLDATLNYYVMMDYCWMYDNTGKNMLLATYDGNVWYPTLYDLDTTWGTTYNGKGLTEYEDELLSVSNNRLWKRFGELYKKEIAERYFELRATLLDTEYVMAKFNEFHNSIPEELLTYETEKWDKEEAPTPGYPLSQIQEYLDSVIPRLDAKYTEWK